MRWSKAFSKTGLLALMLAVVGSGIFFYDYYVADAGAGKRCLGGI